MPNPTDTTTTNITLKIGKEKEGQYFELPFTVPEHVHKIDIRYSYERHRNISTPDRSMYTDEINIIDLALINGEKEHLGSSGSDRNHVTISEYYSTPGYAETEIKHGEWAIVVGAYKIHAEGVEVEYEITFTHKKRCLLKGDLHTHTLGSDGKFTLEEVADIAVKNGLDYIFITDHNNYVQNNSIRTTEDITIMPGTEWTHYKGHINFLGVKKAYDGSFYTNTLEGMQEKIAEAKKSGAIVSINHPFCPNCGFKFGLDHADYDCIEIWNNAMKKSEMDCVRWWHSMLAKGKKIPIVGGSDFHKNTLGAGVGFPTTGLYAMSKAPSDIYKAIRGGNGFVTNMPDGPEVFMELCGKILGETVEIDQPQTCRIQFGNVKAGDLIKIITDLNQEEIELDKQYAIFRTTKQVSAEIFVRVELYRAFTSEDPKILTLISNPIYLKFSRKECFRD